MDTLTAVHECQQQYKAGKATNGKEKRFGDQPPRSSNLMEAVEAFEKHARRMEDGAQAVQLFVLAQGASADACASDVAIGPARVGQRPQH